MERLARDDEWTKDEDRVLLAVALETIEEGGTLTDAFIQTGNAINRTFGAVRFRYYDVVKHEHSEVIKAAHNKRVQRINAAAK